MFATYLMKFATDVLLIAPAIIGTLLAASRLWDALSDPVVGYLSDNTKSSVGRRRVWLYAAAVPMGLGMVMMWSPPLSLTGWILVLWMTIALLLYETAGTAFFVPHGALGVELTPNYHERTRLFGYTHMISAIGLIIGLGFLQLMNMAADKRLMAFYLSLTAGLVVTTLIIWSTRNLSERSDYQGRGGRKPFNSFLDVFKNPHARLLLIMYAIETFGAASISLLVPYLVDYVIPLQAFMVLLLVTYVIPQFAFTPLFIWASTKIGKKPLWFIALLVASLMFFLCFWLITPGQFSYFIWLGTFVFGMCAGAGAVVLPSIQADIIDFDEYHSGERKEGAYLAVWNLIRKASGSVVALLTGFVLQFTGFVPNVEQSYSVQLWILGVFSLLPGVCYFVGAIIWYRFSFNEAEHAAVREALSQRSQR